METDCAVERRELGTGRCGWHTCHLGPGYCLGSGVLHRDMSESVLTSMTHIATKEYKNDWGLG